MSERFDLAVIGAGPAGMAAATTARAHGLSVVVLDEQPAPGGQIFRGITRPAIADARILGADYHAGAPIARAFAESGAAYRPRTLVWHVEGTKIGWTAPDAAGEIEAGRIIVATGAMERPFPVPGWTLPGVMTAGAAQILLKTSGIAHRDAVFAGTGPLLYLVVAQYLRARIPVRLMLDTADPAARLRALKHLPGALGGLAYIRKGLGLLKEIRRAGVTVARGVEALEIVGAERAERVRWDGAGGSGEAPAETVFLHHGVVPGVNLTMALGCRHVFDEAQACWRPETDALGRSSVDGIAIAGDAGGIRGAISAALSGRIAALDAASQLGALDRATCDAALAPLLAQRRRDGAIRPFLDALYRPRDAFRAPGRNDVIVCRCEEVTRGAVAAAIAEGCPGPNQLKSFTRCGMGPCQGRMCGPTVQALFAALTGRPSEDIGHARIRMPVKPVTLGDIAGPDTTTS